MDLKYKSIRTIKSFHDDQKENIIAFSGGKDSIVLWHLAMITGLPFTYIYSNTTIDPPGHINFIRQNYPNVQIINPKYSFYKVVEKYGLPTRHRRFCCQHLKEYIGKGCKVFEGLRIDEGQKRGKRLSRLKEPEMCDTRVKDKIHVYPIMHWTDSDVWSYIHENKLIYPIWYDKGFNRLGCVGCPLANQKQRIEEYKLFPRYVNAVIMAIDKNIKAGRCLSKFFDNPYEAFYWWISELSIANHKMTKLFPIDYEGVIKIMFPINNEKEQSIPV